MSKRWAPGFLILSSVLLSLVAVECGLRIVVHFAPQGSTTVHTLRTSLDQVLYVNTPGGKRLLPNANVSFAAQDLSGLPVSIRTNSLGFRGPEPTSDRPRLLFLGDSITLADYLPEEDTFVSRIQTKAHSEHLSWNVLNAGVGSIGLQEEINLYREFTEKDSAEWVILNLYLNDRDTSPSVHLIHPPGFLNSLLTVRLAWKGFSVGQFAYEQWHTGENLKDQRTQWEADIRARYPSSEGDFKTSRGAFNRLIHTYIRDWGAAWSPDVIRYFGEAIQTLSDRVKTNHSHLLVFIHPVRFQVETALNVREPQDAIMRELDGRGIPYLDFLPTLRRDYQKRNTRLFFDQCHHTAEGSRVIAERAFTFLKDKISGKVKR